LRIADWEAHAPSRVSFGAPAESSPLNILLLSLRTQNGLPARPVFSFSAFQLLPLGQSNPGQFNPKMKLKIKVNQGGSRWIKVNQGKKKDFFSDSKWQNMVRRGQWSVGMLEIGDWVFPSLHRSNPHRRIVLAAACIFP
jgi:hypothetical protein